MLSTKAKAIFAMLGLAVLGTSAMAAPTLTFTDSISAVYDPSGNTVTAWNTALSGSNVPDWTNATTKTYLYRISINVQYTGATAINPWWTAAAADLAPSALSGGTVGGLLISTTSSATQAGFTFTPPTGRQGYVGQAFSSWLMDDGSGNGTTQAGPGFSNNAGSSISSTGGSLVADLGNGQFFTDAVDASDVYLGADPRQSFAQSTSKTIGYVYVLWDGKEKQTFDLANVQCNAYDTGTNQIDSGMTAVAPATLTFGANIGVPEPASLGVLALGGLALLARRRKVA